jgi:hypothetical protein
MDWLRRGREGAEKDEEAMSGRGELLPIRLYTVDVVVPARCDPVDQRVTDILSRGDELAILPDGRDPDDPGSWLSVDPDAVLLIVPPPFVSRPEMRVHRHRQEVRLRIGPYVVTGTAHLRPGEGEDPFLRATQPFLPLTDAVIEQADQPPERVEVVIASFRQIEEFREV